MMKYKVGYIGNLPFAIEYIIFNDFYELQFAIIEKGRLSDELITLLELRKIPYWEINNPTEILDVKLLAKIDFFIMCSYGRKIPNGVLKQKDIYNIHFGKLPYYKGRHPLFYAAVANELQYGITIHKIDNKIDEGDIISIEKVNFYYNENGQMLFNKLQDKIPKLLNKLYDYLINKTKKIEIFDKGEYYKPVAEEDKILDIKNWEFPKIYNIIRIQNQYGGGKYIAENGRIFWIKEISLSKLKAEHIVSKDLIFHKDVLIGLKYKNKLFIKLLRYKEI